jgi:hypothetical protein
MLHCGINLAELTDQQLECGACKICKPESTLVYPFERDLKDSELLVEILKQYIQANTPYKCYPPENTKKPDICVINVMYDNQLICRVEGKLLTGKAFMLSQKLLESPLFPKETLVVDTPKLFSYFECNEQDNKEKGYIVPLFVVWKFDRPCADLGGITVFQEINKLKSIYDIHGMSRNFERETTSSDYKKGHKLGITAKYHFSLRECRPIEQLIPMINNI